MFAEHATETNYLSLGTYRFLEEVDNFSFLGFPTRDLDWEALRLKGSGVSNLTGEAMVTGPVLPCIATLLQAIYLCEQGE